MKKIIKFYVFVEAYATSFDYTDVAETKVFRDKHEAIKYMKCRRNEILKINSDYKWDIVIDTDTYICIVDDNYDEYVLTIREHEL